MQIEPLGDQAGQTEFEEGDNATIGEKEGVIATAKERRSMEPGEWRYFVVWAGGSGSSTFQLRGEGFTVEKVVQGKSHVLGNDELVNGGGVHVQESARLPPGTSARDEGHLAAGATAVSDTGVVLENQAPLMGMFNEYHVWDACTHAPFSGCIPVGVDLNAAASGLQDGGFANITMDTPIDGHVWDESNFYFLAPGSGAGFGYGGGAVGTYGFNVERLTSAAGPSYREPVWGHGARLDGEQLVLSLAEVDYTELEALSTTG